MFSNPSSNPPSHSLTSPSLTTLPRSHPLPLPLSHSPTPLPHQTNTLTGGLSALASLGGYSKWKTTPTPSNPHSGPSTTAQGQGLAPGPGLGSGSAPGPGLAPGSGLRDKDSLVSLIRDDTARLNSVAMFFLKKSFKHVSILEGGFVGAVRYLRQSNPSLSLSSVLVDAQLPLLDAGRWCSLLYPFNVYSQHIALTHPVDTSCQHTFSLTHPPTLPRSLLPTTSLPPPICTPSPELQPAL